MVSTKTLDLMRRMSGADQQGANGSAPDGTKTLDFSKAMPNEQMVTTDFGDTLPAPTSSETTTSISPPLALNMARSNEALPSSLGIFQEQPELDVTESVRRITPADVLVHRVQEYRTSGTAEDKQKLKQAWDDPQTKQLLDGMFGSKDVVNELRSQNSPLLQKEEEIYAQKVKDHKRPVRDVKGGYAGLGAIMGNTSTTPTPHQDLLDFRAAQRLLDRTNYSYDTQSKLKQEMEEMDQSEDGDVVHKNGYAWHGARGKAQNKMHDGGKSWYERLGHGLKPRTADDAISLGWMETADMNRIAQISEKASQGKPLTDGEQALAQAYLVGLDAEAKLQFLGGATNWEKVGKFTGENAPFLVEMAITGGLGTAAANAAKGLVKRGIVKVAGNALKNRLVNGVAKGAASVIGSTAGGMAMAPFSNATWRNFTDRDVAQYQVGRDENGDFSATLSNPASLTERLGKAYINGTMETGSELLGSYIHGVKLFPNIKPGTTVGNIVEGLRGLTEPLRNFAHTPRLRRVNDYLGDTFKWYGLPVEIFTEEYSNLITPLLTGEPEQLKENFSSEAQWDLILGVVGMSAIMGTAQAPAIAADQIHIRRQASGKLRDIESPALKQGLAKAMVATSQQEQAKRLASIDWSGTSMKDRAAAVDYVELVNHGDVSGGIAEAIEQQEQARQAQTLFNALANKDTGNLERVVDADGNGYFLAGGSLEDNGADGVVFVRDETTGQAVQKNVDELKREQSQTYDEYERSFQLDMAAKAEAKAAEEEMQAIRDDAEAANIDPTPAIATYKGIDLDNLAGQTVALSDGTQAYVSRVYSVNGETHIDALPLDEAGEIQTDNNGDEVYFGLDVSDIVSVQPDIISTEPVNEQAIAGDSLDFSIDTNNSNNTDTAQDISAQQEVEQPSDVPTDNVTEERIIPRKQDGTPDYAAMEPAVMFEAIATEFDEDVAREEIANQVKIYENKIAKLSKSPSEDIGRRLANRKAVADLQKRIAGLREAIGLTDESQTDSTVDTAAPSKTTLRQQSRDLGDYLSLEDKILRDIAEGQKFRWMDNGSQRGLATELGFVDSPGERKARFNILANNGITVDQYAERLEHDMDNGVIPSNWDADIRSGILDVLSRVRSNREAFDAAVALRENDPRSIMTEEEAQQQAQYDEAHRKMDDDIAGDLAIQEDAISQQPKGDPIRDAATSTEKYRAVGELVNELDRQSGAQTYVYNDISELPQGLSEQLEPGDEIDGITWLRDSYICAPLMTDTERTRRTYIHEVAGHRALDLSLPRLEQVVLCEMLVNDIGLEHMRSLGIAELSEEIEHYEKSDQSSVDKWKLGREYIAYSTERFFSPNLFNNTTEGVFSVDLSQPVTDETVKQIIHSANRKRNGESSITITGNRATGVGNSVRPEQMAERRTIPDQSGRDADGSRGSLGQSANANTPIGVSESSDTESTIAGSDASSGVADQERISRQNERRLDRTEQGALSKRGAVKRDTPNDLLSEEEFIDVRLKQLFKEIAAPNLTLQEWLDSDESIEPYNRTADEYPEYIRTLVQDGTLQKLFDNSSIGEEIKIRQAIETAGFEVADLIDVNTKKEQKRQKKQQKRAERSREMLQRLGIDSAQTKQGALPAGGTVGDNITNNEANTLRFRRTQQAVETNGNTLVAVHNVSEDKLKDALELGGFPMPSIAITKADIGHTSFGDISLVFGKDTINPSDRRNKVYGEDAWTPTFPDTSLKVNESVVDSAQEKIYSILGPLYHELRAGVYLDLDNLSDAVNRYDGDVYQALAGKDFMKYAYRKAHDNKDNTDINDNDYRNWINSLFEGIVEKRGIRNNKDFFTPMGNKRKWEDLYDAISLDSVVKAMQKQVAKGGQGLFGSSIFGAAQKAYNSIDEIREEAQKRMKNVSDTDLNHERNAITDRLSTIQIPGAGDSISDTFDMIENIQDAVAHSHTPKGIFNYLQDLYPAMTMVIANDIADIVKDIQKLSARYFEAKPYRAVGFDEVRLAVVPSDADAEIIKQLQEQNIPVKTYERGNQEQRKQIVSDATKEMDIRFRNMADANTAQLSSEEVNAQFNEQLQQQIDGTLPKGHIYDLGMPSAALKAAGVPDLPIEMSAARLEVKASEDYENNHPFELSQIMNLPQAIAHPIAVFDSKTQSRSKVILTELTSDATNFIVAIKAENKRISGRRILEVNSIRSVYPKDYTQDIVNWINRGDLLKWVDKEKAFDWLGKQQSNSADVAIPIKGIDASTNIIKNFTNPTILEGEKMATVETMSEELHVPIRIISDLSQIVATTPDSLKDKRGASGWYDRNTKEIVVVLPNCSDVAEVQKTILHEAVGHYGIPELLGRERADELYRQVYNSLPSDIQESLKAKYGSETVAGDEYLSEMAEGNVTPGLFRRVMAAVSAFFRNILGLDLKLSDADMRYILWRSKHNLQNAKTVKEAMDVIEQDQRMRKQIADPESLRKDLPKGTPKTALEYLNSIEPPAEDLRLRKKKKRQPGDPIVTTKQNFMTNMGRKLQDANIPVRQLQEYITKHGGRVGIENDLYSALNRAPGRATERIKRIDTQKFTPLGNTVREISKQLGEQSDSDGGQLSNYKQISDYVAAKSAYERHKSGIKAFSEDLSNPWSREHVENLIKVFEETVDASLVDKLWDQIRDITNQQLEMSKNYGLITTQTYRDIKARGWQYYVPIQGIDADFEGLTDPHDTFGDIFPGKKGSAESELFHKAKGRITKPEDVLGTLQRNVHRTILAGERNAARQFLLRLVDANPELQGDPRDGKHIFRIESRWFTRNPNDGVFDETETRPSDEEIAASNDARQRKKKLEKELRSLKLSEDQSIPENDRLAEYLDKRKDLLDRIEAESQKITVTTRSMEAGAYRGLTKAEEQMHTVTVRKNGVRYVVRLSDPTVANAINNNFEEFIGGWVGKTVDFMGKGTRVLASLSTSWNPEFIIPNNLRDAIWAGVYNAVDADGDFKGYIRNIPNSYTSISRYHTGYSAPLTLNERAKYDIYSPEGSRLAQQEYGTKRLMDSYYDDFLMEGGLTGYAYMHDVKDYSKKLARRIKAKATLGGEVLGIMSNAAEFMGDMSEISTRFATFLSQVQMGRDVREAVNYAKNITINFNTRGEWGRGLNSLFMFYNASMQGVANVYRLTRRNPGRMSVAIVTMMGLGYGMSLLLSQFLAAGGDDGEEWNISDYERYTNFILPGSWFGSEDGYIKIPIPMELRPFWISGVVANDLNQGKIKAEDAWKTILQAASDAFSPLEISADNPGKIITPTLLKPLFEVGLWNTDFAGRQINRVPFTTAQKGLIPDSQLGRRNANIISKTVTKWLNEVGGGNQWTPAGMRKDGSINKLQSLLDISPSTLDHLVGSYTGGIGRMLLRTFDFITTAGDERTARNWPVFNRFYGEVRKEINPNTRYYDIRAKYQSRHDLFRNNAKNGAYPSYYNSEQEAITDYANIEAVLKKMQPYDKALSSMKKMLDGVEYGSEEYARITKAMNRVKSDFIKEYDHAFED